jgi:hypothetical protein
VVGPFWSNRIFQTVKAKTNLLEYSRLSYHFGCWAHLPPFDSERYRLRWASSYSQNISWLTLVNTVYKIYFYFSQLFKVFIEGGVFYISMYYADLSMITCDNIIIMIFNDCFKKWVLKFSWMCQICLMWPSYGTVKDGHITQVVA